LKSFLDLFDLILFLRFWFSWLLITTRWRYCLSSAHNFFGFWIISFQLFLLCNFNFSLCWLRRVVV